MDVADALAQLEQRGWTLAAVADELGLKWLTVYRWRDGTQSPDDPHTVLDRIRRLRRRKRASPSIRVGRPAPER